MITPDKNIITADDAAERSRERILKSLFDRLSLDGQLKAINQIRILIKLEEREREKERQKIIEAAKAKERRERGKIDPEWEVRFLE